ncbi:hypothetical protein GGI08_001191 [Coemansia sp. S2]|nr:hypothetical protein H4S03_006340 [Coemansia sp. S3946]KAJ2067800.1 hypothetical protein GGI08_001191 [Coemansia sp. S2]
MILRRRHGRGTDTATALRTAQPSAERNPEQVEEGDDTRNIPTDDMSMRAVIRQPQTAESSAAVADMPHTPIGQTGPSMANLRPSDSPTRVSGTRASLGTQFAASFSDDRVCVDKTLVCKGFWDVVDNTSRICLPRRSGKTFNLQLLQLFFSPLPELDCLGIMPDDDDSGRATMLSRTTRESFFKESLLKKVHGDFYDAHFMKHAVIFISFDSCDTKSIGGMIIDLCGAISGTALSLLEELNHSKALICPNAQYAEKNLRTCLETAERISGMSEDEAARYRVLPSTLFSALSKFVRRQFGQYILLLDEYDIPFLSLLEGNWDEAGRDHASSMLGKLFQTMFKGNKDKLKGLMTGVFEMSMIKMGSGPNNVKDIQLIPTSTAEVCSSLQVSAVPHTTDSIDHLTDAFWFNAKEVRKMLENCTAQFPGFTEYHDDVMDKIRNFYNGYYIGRFSGKYNPWSVCSFLQKLCDNLRLCPQLDQATVTRVIKSSAQQFWVKTGSTKLIMDQCKRYRDEATGLLNKLVVEYEERNYQPTEVQLAPRPTLPKSISLGDANLATSYFEGSQFSRAAFLSICLQAGYLTRRTAFTVCIPNEELVLVWRNMLAELVIGESLTRGPQELTRGEILTALWQNNTQRLRDLIVSSHQVLVGRARFKESQFANHAANSLKAAAMLGALSHNDAEVGILTDTIVIREPSAGQGRSDMVMYLASTTNAPRQFGVIIEFKFIPSEKLGDDEYCKELADKGLKQINDRAYKDILGSCLECITIGLAIGINTAVVKSQLYRRDTTLSDWDAVNSLLNPPSN